MISDCAQENRETRASPGVAAAARLAELHALTVLAQACRGLAMSLIQVYASTETACEDEMNTFYSNAN
ncbi:hypothetical protein EVAR_89175_1 [Eumeta japonica]|uniref:Uncharacterized protein n=1 Tax=Eumeta variegata TaxID=151549 RepID=A0A4C1YGP9_EUMVA|nr:hypothetical protein EVAR_89175_1 [Eumeta japonica]